MWWPRNDRLDVMNEFIANETHRAAGESRKPGNGNGAKFVQRMFDHVETVENRLMAGSSSGRLRSPPALNRVDLRHLPVFEHFDAIAFLTNNRPRVATHERVAPKMFPAFHRFEQERFPRPA